MLHSTNIQYITVYINNSVSYDSYPRYRITYSPADETNEVPELPLQSSRKGNDTKEDEGEDHTYEPIPFDTPRQ